MIINSKPLKELRSRIALDIGNVLVHIDMDIFINELFILGISKDLGHRFTEKNQPLLDNGLFDIESALHFSFPGLNKTQVERAKQAWLAVISPCKPTIEVLTELLSEGVEVALLSNIGADHANLLSDMLSGQFDRCIKHFSCNVGARKPTKLFYQSFIMDYSNFAENKLYYPNSIESKRYCTFTNMSRGLFLDDRLENIESARPYLDAKIFDITKHISDEDAAKEMIRIIQDI